MGISVRPVTGAAASSGGNGTPSPDCGMLRGPIDTPPLSANERRAGPDRRVVGDRRSPKDPAAEARPGHVSRRQAPRRSGNERRSNETVEEHLRNALQLLANVVESGTLDDEARRDLDAAMFRLRYAVERLRYGAS